MEFIDFVVKGLFSKTEFFILCLLSYYNEGLTATRIEQITDYKRVTVDSSLKRLLEGGRIIREISGNRFIYSIATDDERVKLTKEEYDTLKELNENIAVISSNGWRALSILMIKDNYTINELVNNYEWVQPTAYKVTKKLLDFGLIKKEGTERFILNKRKKVSPINDYLLYQFLKPLLDVKYNTDDPIMNIMNYFCDDSNFRQVEAVGREETDILYNLLNWRWENYDLSYSFWYTFSLGILYSNENPCYQIAEVTKNVRGVYKNNPKGITSRGGSDPYPRKLVNSEKKEIVEYGNLVKKFPNISEYGKLCFSIASIIPVPDKAFNICKGIGKVKINGCEYSAHDYLPLFVDLIELALSDDAEIICGDSRISKATLIIWEKFLKENMVELSLESEYYFDQELGKLIGIPLFDNQSLINPTPMNDIEFNEMLNNSISRLRKRGLKLSNQVLINNGFTYNQ